MNSIFLLVGLATDEIKQAVKSIRKCLQTLTKQVALLFAQYARFAPATMGDQETGADHAAGGGGGGVFPCNYIVLRNGYMCVRDVIWMAPRRRNETDHQQKSKDRNCFFLINKIYHGGEQDRQRRREGALG